MVPKEFLLIAGDAESDRFAAALVLALRRELTNAEPGYGEGLQPLHASLEPRFYGAGGPQMSAAGMELVCQTEDFQTARHNTLKRLLVFRRVFDALYQVAVGREPHAIVGVGFFGFNLRFARAIKHYIQRRQGTFFNWAPLLVQFGAPPEWFGRAHRLKQAGRHIDLLLSTEPLEKVRDTIRAPELHAEFVGEVQDAACIPEATRRAGRVIVQRLIGSEAEFPLRAYLSRP